MRNEFWLSQKFERSWIWVIGLAIVVVCWGTDVAVAATAKEIDVSVDVVLENFEKDVDGAKKFLAEAKGLLVFPKVIKAGVGVGGEIGEGALRINGKTVDYYNTMAGSFGLQFGAQVKTVMIVFLDEEALKRFRKSEGWKVGVDGSVAVIAIGAGTSLDSSKVNQPIVGFVLDQRASCTTSPWKDPKLQRSTSSPSRVFVSYEPDRLLDTVVEPERRLANGRFSTPGAVEQRAAVRRVTSARVRFIPLYSD